MCLLHSIYCSVVRKKVDPFKGQFKGQLFLFYISVEFFSQHNKKQLPRKTIFPCAAAAFVSHVAHQWLIRATLMSQLLTEEQFLHCVPGR